MLLHVYPRDLGCSYRRSTAVLNRSMPRILVGPSLTERSALFDRRFNWYIESIADRFAIGQADENRASHRCIPRFPRFLGSFVIELHMSLSTLVHRLNALGFDLIGCSNFNSEHRHTVTVSHYPLKIPVG